MVGRIHSRVSDIAGYLGFGIMGCLGIGLFLLHLIHALGEGENLQTFLFGIAIPMMFCLGVLAGGLWLWQTDVATWSVFRISAWTLTGAGALALTTGLLILYEQAEGVLLSDQWYVIAGQASIGSVIGFIVGYYDVRKRATRERAERLSQRLTILNRVLRHDIRSEAQIIQGRANQLTTDTADDSGPQMIHSSAERLVDLGNEARLIERLLTEDSLKLKTIDLVEPIETHVGRITREYPHVIVETSLPERAPVYAHPLVGSAIANILDNAVKHNDKETPIIEIDCLRIQNHKEELIEVQIADNGPGINRYEVEVLERGYETPLEHTGGLGLWLVNWIAEESDANVRFEENDPTGSVVCLRFQAVNESPR